MAEDEASGFDASGAHLLVDGLEENGENGSYNGSGPGWASQTDATSLSNGMSSLDLESLDFAEKDMPSPTDEAPGTSFTSQLDNMGDEEKEAALMGIFPILKPFDIKWCLKKSEGNASVAIDELMNQSFLEENGIRHKGIDAFSESDIPPRHPKGKAKGKKKRAAFTEDYSTTSVPRSTVQSKWEIGRQDIGFIATRIGMPPQQVSSIYHNSGGSLKATISAIISAHKALNIENDDPVSQMNISELRQDFPSLQTPDLEALLQLTHPSLLNARELAKALSSQSTGSKMPIQLEFRHAPLNLDSEPATLTTKHKTKSVINQSLDPAAANTIAATYADGRNTAFNQASQYYRKSKSNPLMAGAAAYYAQNGRDLHALAKAAESDAADALVATQSTRGELDLHGVGVRDAVRISRERVTAWWSGAQVDGSGRRGGGGAYKIVTGRGNHSVGQAKLGPAVGKMLVREGWNVEVGSGILVVRGVVRRK